MSRPARRLLQEAFHSLQDLFPNLHVSAHAKQTVKETLTRNGDLGLICFGGPAVHFQVVGTSTSSRCRRSLTTAEYHHRFVQKHSWLSETDFQELFAVTQALSGPASTKMLYCINLRRNGFLAALSAFLLWSYVAPASLSLGEPCLTGVSQYSGRSGDVRSVPRDIAYQRSPPRDSVRDVIRPQCRDGRDGSAGCCAAVWEGCHGQGLANAGVPGCNGWDVV